MSALYPKHPTHFSSQSATPFIVSRLIGPSSVTGCRMK